MSAHAGPEQRREWVLEAVERYEAPLVRFACRLVGDEHAARDIVQHVFLRLCDQVSEDLEGRMAQWLFAVCRNKAIDWLRQRRRSSDAGDLELSQCPSHEPDPAAAAEQRDMVQQLGRLMNDLPQGQREAISLWVEGFSYRQIASILETSEGNVRVLMHRAIKRLRENAASRCCPAKQTQAESGTKPQIASEVPS